MTTIRYVVGAFLLPALLACSDNSARAPTATTVATDTSPVPSAVPKYRVHYNTPVGLDSTDFYYQPVSMVLSEELARGLRTSIPPDDEAYAEQRNNVEGVCYNVLFFNKKTQAERLLLSHGRFVITTIDAASKPAARWPHIFYTCIKADTNADSLLNGQDASTLFVSGRDGQQFRQLTPDNTHLERMKYIAHTSLLLVEVRPDDNHDHRFTHTDGTYWLRFDLQNLTIPAVRLPSASLRVQLQQQLTQRQKQMAHRK